MKKLLLIALLCFTFQTFSQEKKRLYLGNDTHTDWMYNGDYDKWKQYIFDMTDFYLGLGEGTIKEKPEARSKWNYDSSIWLYMLEKHKSPEYFNRVLAQLKNNQASVPYNFILPAYGATPAEAVIRGMYYSGYLERKYGLDIDIAVAQENATIPLGLSSIWAGSGVKYSWKGVCNCATYTNLKKEKRNHEIYYYTGLDDSKVLMKWYSNGGWNAELGGYAEILEPTIAVIQMDTLCDSKRYPYRIAGAFGKGWDNIVNYSYDLQWGIGHRTRPGTQVILSNQMDFFQDFEKTYGSELPKETLAFGNEWDILCTSLSEVAAGVKRSIEKLRTAEALASVVVTQEPDAFKPLEELKQRAYFALGTYWIHSWTADGPIKRHDVATWARGEQKALQRYVDTLYQVASKKLANKIIKTGDLEQFYVFNAMNWERADYVNLEYDGDKKIYVLNSEEKIVPHQFYTENGKKYLQILAQKIPSVGYKKFSIISTKNKSNYFVEEHNINEVAVLKKLQNGIFENKFYKLNITKSGVITSLFDKKLKHEFVKNIDGKFMNDLGGTVDIGSPIEIENQGIISTTIVCKSNTGMKHETRITLFNDLPRIEIQNKILQNFGDPQFFSHSFNIENPEIWHEEVGAVIKAKYASEGGHYADKLGRYDYQTLNHFVDVSNEKLGVTISNTDAYFMKIGNSTPEKLDSKSSQINVLIGGQVDKELKLGIPMQDGDSLFVQSYAIQTHAGKFDQTNAIKMAMEHQTPLVSEKIMGGKEFPTNQFSLIQTEDRNAILWALKPSEESTTNKGIVARFWNFGNDINLNINLLSPLEKVEEVTHVETRIGNVPNVGNSFKSTFRKNQMKSFLIGL
jgi:alpha-mannosidase